MKKVMVRSTITEEMCEAYTADYETFHTKDGHVLPDHFIQHEEPLWFRVFVFCMLAIFIIIGAIAK